MPRFTLQSQEVFPGDAENEGYFHFIAADGAELKITQNTLAQLVTEYGVEGAQNHVLAQLNSTFEYYRSEGVCTIGISADGSPLEFTQERLPEE